MIGLFLVNSCTLGVSDIMAPQLGDLIWIEKGVTVCIVEKKVVDEFLADLMSGLIVGYFVVSAELGNWWCLGGWIWIQNGFQIVKNVMLIFTCSNNLCAASKIVGCDWSFSVYDKLALSCVQFFVKSYTRGHHLIGWTINEGKYNLIGLVIIPDY